MKNDGKGLESFICDIEKAIVGTSLKLIQNRRVYSDDGVQLAELDLEIEGMVKGRYFRSLLECRDRPSQGRAPASWIQQMAGRRFQFGFDEVIAVSTMGFSDAAIAAARMFDVDLRQLTVNSPSSSPNWFESPGPGSSTEITCRLIHARKYCVGIRRPHDWRPPSS